MYSVYKYNNGATQANVLADVVAILTGTTDVSTLSASCDKVNSTVLTTWATAGWLMHDATPGTANSAVLKAPISDNPGQFKYLWLSTNTANAFISVLYESWNATSHTGTNPTSYDSTAGYTQRVNYAYASGGFIYISSSENHALFHTYSSGNAIGTSNTLGPTGCVDYTRWNPWDVPANGYLPTLSPALSGFSNGNQAQLTRVKTPTGTDAVGDPARSYISFMGCTALPSAGRIPNSAGNLIVPLIPIYHNYTSSAAYWHLGGNITEKCNIWGLGVGSGSFLDETTSSGNQTYVIWTCYSNFRIAVPKG